MGKRQVGSRKDIMLSTNMICLYRFFICSKYFTYIEKDNDLMELLLKNKFRLFTADYMPKYIGLERG